MKRSLLERMIAHGVSAPRWGPDWKDLPRLARKVARGEALTEPERRRAALALLLAAGFRTRDLAHYAVELVRRGRPRKAAIVEAMTAAGIDAAKDPRGRRAIAKAIERQKRGSVARKRPRAMSRK